MMCETAQMPTPEQKRDHLRLLTDERQDLKATIKRLEGIVEQQAEEITRLKRERQ
ncbi:MAG: hypothetical protein U9Q07_03820 [Planctomycetota bacterium]|nr:hypothetical protein [Planctomycetota bacterium]